MSKLLPSNERLVQLLREYKVELNKEVSETISHVDGLIEILSGSRKSGPPLIDFNPGSIKLMDDYPRDGELLQKIQFISLNIFKRACKSPEIEKKIIEYEGPKTKTIRSIWAKMKRLVDQKELIQMIYNGSNKKSFYLADKHWLDGKEIQIEHAHPEQMDLIQHHKIKRIDIKGI